MDRLVIRSDKKILPFDNVLFEFESNQNYQDLGNDLYSQVVFSRVNLEAGHRAQGAAILMGNQVKQLNYEIEQFVYVKNMIVKY